MKGLYSGKIMILLTVCFLALILVPSGPVRASEPNTGYIEGTIYKADGETPLRDARLILEQWEKGKKTGKEYESNITDETGEYRLEDIPEGFYRGKIYIGIKHYKIKRVDFFFHVFAGETNTVSFSLKKKK
ncbi:MAG: carboxypeptidase regulatory-like domain-containing protein [Candidatus Aminicenantes bacterium]|nr:MAG: carboxypeptidase regulatory-like domain-containing protein [Candidatus Aminicenantes bacterium]